MTTTATLQQEILRETVRDFARSEIRPHVMEWDEAQQFPLETIRRLGEIGMLGALVDPEYGGAGLSYPDYVIVIEELSRVDASIGLSVAAHNSLCTNHIALTASDDQKRRWLPRLASGEALGAWALTEPGAGSDAAAARTRALRDGDSWLLSGTKNFITHATYADVYVVLAVTDPEAGTRGISAFVIEKGTPGLTPGAKENKLGCRASDTASLILEDCRVPDADRIGSQGHGFVDALKVLDGGRISIAAMALGISEGALGCSLAYARERQQFGKAISEFQGIQFKLAEMATRVEAARRLTYEAAALKATLGSVPRESSMAKLYASETAVWVSEQAVQIHGGYGYTKDYPAEKYWRDSKLCTIGEGTSEIQKIVIARELLS